MKKIDLSLLIFISLLMISCGGKDDGGGGDVDPPDPVNPPTASGLISPAIIRNVQMVKMLSLDGIHLNIQIPTL